MYSIKKIYLINNQLSKANNKYILKNIKTNNIIELSNY
jgi:hypothetical protein